VVNTVSAIFDTVTGQMTEIPLRKKTLHPLHFSDADILINRCIYGNVPRFNLT